MNTSNSLAIHPADVLSASKRNLRRAKAEYKRLWMLGNSPEFRQASRSYDAAVGQYHRDLAIESWDHLLSNRL
jgi:hypothetical protein